MLIGLGGVICIATLRYCANWYRADEFATVTGLMPSASPVGGLLAATPLAVLVAASAGATDCWASASPVSSSLLQSTCCSGTHPPMPVSSR